MCQPDYPEDEGRNRGGGRDSQNPCPHDAARYAPAYGRKSMYRADSNDCSGNGVRRAYGNSGQGGAEQSQSAGAFSAESTDWFEFGDLGTHGVNDAPSPKIGSQGNGCVGGQNDWPLKSTPVVRHIVRSHVARSKKCAGHNPHGFLRVIPTVADAVSCGGNELEPAEPIVDCA